MTGTTTTSRGIEHIGPGGGSDGPLLLSAKQAAKSLGVSERTLFTLATDGDLPSVKIGRRRLYSAVSLAQWVAEKQARTMEGGADHA
jgi:excisionase family DNA binding protein